MTVLAAVCACGRDAGQAESVQGGHPVEAGPIGSVWVVDSQDTGGRLYLCGTIHILRKEDYPLAPAYEAAYSRSDKLVFELPPDAAKAGAAARMTQLGTLPPGATLEAEVGSESWSGVKKWCASRGVPPFSMARMRPWLASLMITNNEYAVLGASPDMGVDQHFEKRARRDGKPGEGLETLEFQIQLFAGLSEELQRVMLDQTLAEVGTLPEEYDKMIEAWKHGRLDDLQSMLFREAAKHPELMEIFLAARNRAWMARLEDLLKKGERAMVLVGTGHFTAETGLLHLLKERGYLVRHYREMKED
ncbi:MAG TPA: TraB/GumN family protein [Prosthecobacter sp.]|nr:TraB/GumN family protein [Prosthecobacter sp.]